ncbi:hypothetical protein ACFXJO_08870 [Streptomyces lavendulae]|uniref:hypothetical protein n=1 Tax=Streptomyces TaxID=1883 RepID=UPI00247707FF|nr:hypothetical protein [Streptomyces sp. SPB4]MDH6540122.1 hypothetical protein [Streptomyces sp. SPB4]
MSDHRFTPDETGSPLAPAAARTPRHPHHLRYERPAGTAPTGAGGHGAGSARGLTVVTCACGLTTPAMPDADARLVYEEHRNVIRDETG